MHDRIKLMDRIAIERAMPFKRPLPPRSDDRGFYPTGWPPKPPTWRDHAKACALCIVEAVALIAAISGIGAAFIMWGAL